VARAYTRRPLLAWRFFAAVSHNRAVSAEERYEQLLAYIASQLSPRVQQDESEPGSITFTGGSPSEVIVRLTADEVAVFEYAGSWETPAQFTVQPRHVGTVMWQRLPDTALMNALAALIKGARSMRLHSYGVCVMCERKTPPESLFDDDVCVDCASREDLSVH
jgi:hypothetical protein